jgi:hypothetical protein
MVADQTQWRDGTTGEGGRSVKWTYAWVIVVIVVVCLFAWILRKHGMKEGAAIASPFATTLLGLSVLFLTFHQADQARQKAATERTANWTRFHGACLDMFDILDSKTPRGIEAFESLAASKKSFMFAQLRRIIAQQSTNPVLIENKECLGYWRNMESSAWTAIGFLELGPDDATVRDQIQHMFSSIGTDLAHVWDKMVLRSGEISATGGRPGGK